MISYEKHIVILGSTYLFRLAHFLYNVQYAIVDTLL